mmetsp:Transcript_13460/g.20472  ORF Transcript_13460/g.20472 Transcript_13460/m.20472 type:complete len:800 (-) Transcript_13460:1513-3912(-)|eukprot:CAMPEP_0178896696 /NCGR_PEP_ID=MMETSP0786-20121207/1324_1 /TAXON_ID=186022 /ORGANISM="Thalassionema frauenfeldii, Strain CCMP 1798" /LENGTH=799 /DNA_ID=CAMNT_0020567143 /DNA_START=99 /DNA_END=2498 /DNA_ORIENTATION=-
MVAPSFPGILPDYIDDPSTQLDSFAEIRNKNLESLYGKGNDKSPKGFVDAAICDLVNLINAHPSFVTLSSCSGRIAVFDPKKENFTPDLDSEQEEGSIKISDRTAKGRGEWIFVSHEPVEKSSLVELLRQNEEKHDGFKNETETLVFKHEPLLLHVAACSLPRGRQLLNLALQLGFRESGLVVSQNRVTVAIRSHSLALCVPLSRHGPLRPSDDYLVALVKESNRLMSANMKKLSRLENEIRTCLFVPILSNENIELQDGTLSKQIRSQRLPPLNLWGHDAVVVPGDGVGFTVFVFGGYGLGPNTQNARTGRSDQIFSIQRHPEGYFSEQWDTIKPVNHLCNNINEKEEQTTWFGVECAPAIFSAVEGLQACLLPLNNLDRNKAVSSPVIVIFGGRSDPSAPFGSLLLYEPKYRSDRFMEPTDVRGDIPSPRWGHTLTSLSGKDGLMAILVGGRNERAAVIDNVHILKLVTGESGRRFFEWHLIRNTAIPPQFHHAALALKDDTVIISGGIMDPNNLMECFSAQALAGVYAQGQSTKPKALSVHQIMKENEVKDIPLPDVEGYTAHYGSSCCGFRDQEDKTILLFCGGLPMEIDEAKKCDDYPIQVFYYDGELSRYEINYSRTHDDEINFGSMVHHCCLTLPNVAEFMILGGGVSSFAFGATFAESYHVNFSTNSSVKSEVSCKQILADVKAESEDTSGNKSKEVNVVFVEKQNAMALRVALSDDNLLNKHYRMIRADKNAPLNGCGNYIAVPMNREGFRLLHSREKPIWCSMIVAEGLQEMPLSTAVMGLKKNQSMKL